VIHETGFGDTFYYFGNERQIRDWPIVRELDCFCAAVIMVKISFVVNNYLLWLMVGVSAVVGRY